MPAVPDHAAAAMAKTPIAWHAVENSVSKDPVMGKPQSF